MVMRSPTVLLTLIVTSWLAGGSLSYEGARRGPSFLMEPPPKLEFSNSSGGRLDCTASGTPSPLITWTSLDGQTVSDVPGVRRLLANGTLLLLSFPPELYRQDVHSAVYRCAATNSVGTVISRDVHVRAVVTQMYKVSVRVLTASRGCTAVLQCLVDRSARDLVKVVSWLQEPSFNIYPSLQGDGKYHVLPSGELLIHSVQESDERPRYRCRTRHRLTKHLESSSSASISLLDSRGHSPPAILEHLTSVTVHQDEGAVLVCVAHGCPAPDYRWFQVAGGYEPIALMAGPRTRVLGPVLAVEAVSEEDAGVYRCIATNPAGEATAEIRLNVLTQLIVEITPHVSTVKMGATAEFRCTVAHGSGAHLITWYKDGRVMPGRSNGELLVLNGITREDQGMYQCIARRAEGDTAQASAELQLGDAAPILLYSFIEQTLQPGPAVSLKCTASGNPTPHITWLLDGFSLPHNTRFIIGKQISLHGDVVSHVNITHVVVEDGGEYTCTAHNRAGKVSHSARLNVYGLPYIRLIPKVTAVAGEELQIKCPVAGYPIEEIKWEKGGRELPDDLRQKVIPSTGVLIINPVQKNADAGLYTCWARNKQGQTARRNGEVTVIVPPRWIVEPSDTNVERNRNALLHCQAQGVPTPTITWKKATSSKSGDYEEVRDRMYTKVFSNGSLLLQNVKEDREGFYLCQARNGIGNGIGKVLQLKVNSSPYFSDPPRTVTVKKGDTAVLTCRVQGDTPISVRWFRQGKIPLTPVTNYRVNLRQELTGEGVVVGELQVAGTEAADSGAYFCKASNLYGEDQQLVQLTVQEPPEKPSELKAFAVTSRSVNLQWAHQTGDPTDVTKYIVQYKEAAGGSWKQVELSGQVRGALVEGLKPATKYLMRVAAEGPAGRSGPSSELRITTEPQKPAGPPLNLSIRPVSSTKLLVSWSPPLAHLRHGDIQGYYVGYKEISAVNSNYNMTAVTGDGEDGTGELILAGLAKYTRYTVVVQAYNQVGRGPLSEPVSAQTLEDAPGAPPEALRCSALSSQSVQISWQPPPAPHCNGIIQGYKLIYDTHDPEIDIGMDVRKTTALTLILTGLRRFTNYTVQVLAFTRIGDGPFSKIAYCHTDEDAPGSPGDIKVMISSPQSLLVSWLPPLQPNGIITKYTLYTRVVDGQSELNHGKRNIPHDHTYFESKNLQQHIEYQFWVTASTRVGEGPSSRVVSQVPTNRVPARVVSFGQVVRRPWHEPVSLPCLAVGAPRREWLKNEAIVRPSNDNNLEILETGELVIARLSRTDTDNYTCHVENSVGSDRIHYSLVVQVPPNPPVLYVTSATSSSVSLHWKAGDSGGAPILGYILQYKKAQQQPEEVALSRRTTSHELKGLSCGSTYAISLRSFNKLGPSHPSPVLPVRTQGQYPGVPAPSAFLQPNSTSVTLRLHVWPDNGCPIYSFVVRYKSVNDMEWILVSNSVKPQKKFTVPGLLSSSEYNLQVEAHNIAGSSIGEFQFYTLTKDGELPPPELVRRGHYSKAFYTDVRVMIPLLVAIISIFIAATALVFCHRTRQARTMKETLDNQQNAEAQRERYYATIHKVPLQASNDKIPEGTLCTETSEDISPYATFQLSDPNSTLLHSFMYHEQALQEQGCTSVPPQAVRPQHPIPCSGDHRCNVNVTVQCSKGRRARRRSSRKTDAETDESDSDPEQITSSRTESSNHLDSTVKAGKQNQGYTYQGTHSSTSSDISPMSEAKSLPRRGGRARWLGPGMKPPLRPSLSIAETAFRGDRPELSEAECDIDTLKKLKLGIRSTLWSRPSSQNPHSDYSIAV
ncbi:Down syndrome cell adhesion molecule 2 isoform X7 [Rhodnius prolixus]|uniref:Down syndrome cell adhesion molecule 2 isoform X7 n=1 Tax=Rhodnius prolixus TaxID=13249 RepID=UPI003D189330